MIETVHDALGHRAVRVGVAAVAALTYLAVVDPHDPRTPYPPCPTKLLTGLDCPACGGLRATHDLLHGDLAAAVHDNAFLLASGPIIAVLSWRRWQSRDQPGATAPSEPGAYLVAGVALAWMLIRNTPAWPLKPLGSRSLRRATSQR